MSVILVDLGDDKHDVMVSNAGWRDTLTVLRPFGVLDEERLQRNAGKVRKRLTFLVDTAANLPP